MILYVIRLQVKFVDYKKITKYTSHKMAFKYQSQN